MHDWTDLPEEEVPEMAQVATGGNPDAAHAMVENLQACKGRGNEYTMSWKVQGKSK